MAGMSRESFPELPQMPEATNHIASGMLSSMISKTIFAISMEESRFTLNGALLLIKPDSIVMVSTDGHRLAYIENQTASNGESKPFRALVPKKAMNEILKLAQEGEPEANAVISGDDNHLFFQFGDRLLITRKLTGNFPDYERVLPKDHHQVVTLQRDEIKSAVERVSQFADERSRAIRVQFGPGEVKVFTSSVETGESEESVPTSYAGPEIDIGFNAQYLLDFLKVITQDQVSFELKDQKSAGEMRPAGEVGNYRYRYVVMPMRI
jgi:DNA polymerase-3 subunit beta